MKKTHSNSGRSSPTSFTEAVEVDSNMSLQKSPRPKESPESFAPPLSESPQAARSKKKRAQTMSLADFNKPRNLEDHLSSATATLKKISEELKPTHLGVTKDNNLLFHAEFKTPRGTHVDQHIHADPNGENMRLGSMKLTHPRSGDFSVLPSELPEETRSAVTEKINMHHSTGRKLAKGTQ